MSESRATASDGTSAARACGIASLKQWMRVLMLRARVSVRTASRVRSWGCSGAISATTSSIAAHAPFALCERTRHASPGTVHSASPADAECVDLEKICLPFYFPKKAVRVPSANSEEDGRGEREADDGCQRSARGCSSHPSMWASLCMRPPHSLQTRSACSSMRCRPPSSCLASPHSPSWRAPARTLLLPPTPARCRRL